MSEKSEVSVGLTGVKLSGNAAEDVRPLIQGLVSVSAPVVRTAESVLRFAENAITMPLDFLSTNLEGFRAKYRQRFDAIPPDRQQQPPMRVACAVLTGAAYAADEPDIQEMFAALLASASDSRSSSNVHPSFATVIGDLRASDGKVLVAVKRFAIGSPPWSEYMDSEGISQDELGIALANLTRLGLIGRRDIRRGQPLHTFTGGRHGIPDVSAPHRLHRAFEEVYKDIDRVRDQVAKREAEEFRHQMPTVTPYGARFIAAVLPEDERGATGSPTRA